MVLITSLKEQILEKRAAIRAAHQAGATGQAVSSSLLALAENTIAQLYRVTLEGLDVGVDHQLSERISIVALGGFGRAEMSPHSDIDLMVLNRGKPVDSVHKFSAELFRNIWDVGFQVGHSVRTIDDCIALGKSDLSAKTALMEARFLIGSASLFRDFHEKFGKQVVRRHVNEFLLGKIEERYREYDRYGTSVYMLEPDIKRSKGGLRDLHFVQWAALARYSIATLEDLHCKAFLSNRDFKALISAREFLSRVRAELHFHAGSPQDILTFDEQIRLAEKFNFSDEPHLRGVERFMQQYYRHTTAVADISERFVKRCRIPSVWDRFASLFPSKRPERGFLVRNCRLTIDPAYHGEVMRSGVLLMRLFFLSVKEKISIDDDLLEELHIQIDGMMQEQFMDPMVNEMFLHILSGPHKIVGVLNLMHRVHLLEKMIPAFGSARGLMQFNQYHKYTVDAHTLEAVACAQGFSDTNSELRERASLSRVYREIRRKDLLHLALLLHDLGKGKKGDHSVIGGGIARAASQRLGLNNREMALLVFLVENHLRMSHIAQRRDLSDPKVIQKFSKQVGTPEVLKMLYVLTAADIAAVGPETLTTWKRDLLAELFIRTLDTVAGPTAVPEDRDSKPVRRIEDRLLKIVPAWWAKVSSKVGEEDWKKWVEVQTRVTPVAYLLSTPHEIIMSHLEAIAILEDGGVEAKVSFDQEKEHIDITVYAFDNLVPNIFTKIAGAMAVSGLQVLGARITTRLDHLVIDQLRVVDSGFVGDVPVYRLQEIRSTIVRVLTGSVSLETLLAKDNFRSGVRMLPTSGEDPKVEIDNDSSDYFTIIDIFADDRQGLLYVITNAVSEMGLSVHSAKISTKLDQVVDVLYVSDALGQKVLDPSLLQAIQERLLEDVRRSVVFHQSAPAA